MEIARCLASDPSFILLDEPLAGIDPIAIKDVKNLIHNLKKRNIGVLITDHNVKVLSKLSIEHILFLRKELFKEDPTNYKK